MNLKFKFMLFQIESLISFSKQFHVLNDEDFILLNMIKRHLEHALGKNIEINFTDKFKFDI